jgi:predicted PurR-regulated permease PerM
MPPKTNPTKSHADGAMRFRWAFLLLLVVGTSVLFLFMIGRFLIAVFLAAVLAGLAQPLLEWLREKLGNRPRLAALVTLLVLVLGVGLPLVGFLAVVAAQAIQVGDDVGAWVQEQSGRLVELEAWARRIPVIGASIPQRAQLAEQVTALTQRAGSILFGTLTAATRGTLSFVLQFFIMLYALFFFLLDGPKLLRKILGYTPLSPVEQVALLERFTSVTRATLKGSLLIGLLQGTLAGLAFWVAGVPAATFWGAVMVVLAIIPAVGAGLVWVPAVVYLFFAGAVVAAIGLALWCALVVGTVDNLLRPRLVGRDARMSDLLILLSTLGGIVLFGAVGFVVGPIIGALFVTTWDIYGDAFQHWLPAEPEPLVQESTAQEGAVKPTGERVADLPQNTNKSVEDE